MLPYGNSTANNRPMSSIDDATMLPSVSIVIPVRNESRGLKACLESWLSQTVEVNEIVVIDSGSTDGTVTIARQFQRVIVREIPSSDFNHGTTRNHAMKFVTGDLTLMTVGDARASDNQVLEKLTRHFTDEKVAGACGIQIVPHETDKNPVEWFKPQSKPISKHFCFKQDDEFENLLPEQKQEAASWDDVIAMYRTKTLRDQIPFRTITYGEDPAWAVDALRLGHKLVYDPEARVYHYHLENSEITYKRAVTMYCLRNWLFGTVPNPINISARQRLRILRCLLLNKQLTSKQKMKWYFFNISNLRAIQRATKDFLEAIKQGPERLQELHDHCSGKPFKVELPNKQQ
jgi:rhamnosyltransferase